MKTLGEIKTRQQSTWAAGDFSMVATTMVLVGELLCESMDLHAGDKVIDVATGSGNAAIAAARRWCQVTGTDYVEALIERARERATCERLEIDFRVGDAEQIEFPDSSFDAVVSTFGSMFAPDQAKAASELLRVCRSRGKIGLSCWTPDSFVGEWFKLAARFLPPPPNLRSPVEWGTEKRLRELFGEHLSSFQANRRSFVFRYLSPEHWLEYFKRYFGPTVKAFEYLEGEKAEEFTAELMKLARFFNRSDDVTLVLPADYLEVVMVKR